MNSTLLEIQKQNILLANTREIAEAQTLLPSTIPATTAPPDSTNPNLGQIDNLLDNSDFDYSKDGYLNNPTVGGDAAQEVYNFYRHRLIKLNDVETTTGASGISSPSAPFLAAYTYPLSFIIYGAGGAAGETLTGTLTRASDTDAILSTDALKTISGATMWFGDTLAETSANAVKSAPHTLLAANEGVNANIPQWDKINGWVEHGSATLERFSIDTPLPLNVVRAGLTIFIIAIVSRKAAATVEPSQILFGIWDGSTAQNRWIEGGNFNLTATAKGTTGGSVVSYKAIAVLSDGSEVESNTGTATNSNAVLSGANYNRLVWENAPSILDFRLYRKTGSVVKRIFTITNGSNDYNDTGGDEGEVLADFPTTSETKALVYKITPPFTPVSGSWTAIGVRIQVPSTYNASLTTGKQWFRAASVAPATDARSLLIDRVGLSFRPGAWNRSGRDKTLAANQNPSSNPTSSDQGGTGIDNCFEKLTLVRKGTSSADNLEWVTFETIEKGDYLWAFAKTMRRVKSVKRSIVSGIELIVLQSGAWFRATKGERFITSRADKDGTRVNELMEGDKILCPFNADREIMSESEIAMMETLKGEFEVMTVEFYGDEKTYAVGNYAENGVNAALAHNRKEFYDPYQS